MEGVEQVCPFLIKDLILFSFLEILLDTLRMGCRGLLVYFHLMGSLGAPFKHDQINYALCSWTKR
jgi:hypothetical protein